MSGSTGAAGVPLSLKRPGAFVQVVFGASPSGAGGSTKKILLLGHKTSSGSATTNTDVKQITVDDDAANYFGYGEIYLMAKVLRKKYPLASLYAIAVTEPAGVAASQTFTVTSAATGNGTLLLFIHGVQVDVPVYSGDAATTQATRIRDAINAKTESLLVSASASSNIVTVTCKHVGTRGNKIRVRHVADASITGSTYAWGASALASGTGDDTLTTALSTAATSRYDFYVCAHVVTSQLQAIQTQLDTMSGPLVGRRQQAIAASTDSFGTATTQVEALNEERMQLLWQPSAEDLPGVIAAAWAGNRVLAESTSVSTNLSLFNPDAVSLAGLVTPQPSESDWVTDSQANSALDVGLTPIQINGNTRQPYVPLSITTHSNDANGNPDTRTLTTNMVSVPDAFADEFESWVTTAFPDKKLRADAQSGDDVRPSDVVTPGDIKAQWKDRARIVFDNRQNGHINDLDGDYASWAFNLVTGNSNRVNCTMGVTPAPWFTQISAQIRQLST